MRLDKLALKEKPLSYRAIDAIFGQCRRQLGPPLTTHICGWVGHFFLSPGSGVVDPFTADIHTTTPEAVSVTQVSIEPTIPGAGNQVSGFVWLDNNADGLQSAGEPGFSQAIPGHRAPSVALYPEGSSEFIDITLLDENSNGQYVFKNVPAGDYYVCISNEFRILDLDVTAQNAGDDIVDSDFDSSPCTYGVTISAEQGDVRDLGLTGGSIIPDNGNQVSGFVWLDNNADGLQSDGEPGFAQTVPNFGAPSVALYPEGSTEFIDIAFLDESSNGQYQFNNVPNGQYYVCVSNEFRQLGLSVTTQDAGDDLIDSDFDSSPCAYGITVTDEQGAVRDLGLRQLDVRAFLGYKTSRVTPSSSLNPKIAYNSISISAEHSFSVRDRLIAEGFSRKDAERIARNYVNSSKPGVRISGNGAFVRTISGGSGNPQYQPDIFLSVSDVVVDEVNRGFARLILTNATVNKKIYAGAGIDNLPLIFKNSTLCGVYFEELFFPGTSDNPCP